MCYILFLPDHNVEECEWTYTIEYICKILLVTGIPSISIFVIYSGIGGGGDTENPH